MILEWKRVHKPRRTLSGFLRISMEFGGCKVQLEFLHENFISDVANPEILYMLLRFQILFIDFFIDFYWFFSKKNKTFTLTENLLNFNGTYLVGSSHLKVFRKIDVLSSDFLGGRCVFTNLNFICTRFLLFYS